MLTAGQLNLLLDEPLGSRRNRVERAIELAGVTQEQVASATGFTQPYVSAVSKGRYGRQGLPTESSRRFADFFGCSIEDLFPAQEAVSA